MKRARVAATFAALAVAALLAGAAAANRSCWVAPTAAQVDAWLHRAADANDAGAERALVRWAGRGNVAARRDYVALLEHRGDAASHQRLVEVLRDGADAGDGAAATRLAGLLVHDGVAGGAAASADSTQVLRLYEQGSARGVAEATRMLGVLASSNGPGGAADPARAASLFAQASAQGDAPAMFLFANLLRAGQGVTRDEALALQWYQRAADADYAPAIQALGLAYRYGELGLPTDASQSQLMDHEAAEALAHSRARGASAGRS